MRQGSSKVSSARSGPRVGPLAFLAALAGCAASEPAAPPRAVRFAALVAPRVGPAADDAAPDALSAEDVLLEVVTTLSAEPDLDFVLVDGPVVAPTSTDPLDREGVVGALGSIAAPVLVGLTAEEAADLDLLEALERGLPKHLGAPAYAARPVAGWRAVALGPDGARPTDPAPTAGADEDEADDDAPPALEAAAYAGASALPPGPPTLVLRRGGAPGLAVEGGRVVLTLPALVEPPHVYALVTISPDGEVGVRLKTALGAPPPPAPPPVQLPTP